MIISKLMDTKFWFGNLDILEIVEYKLTRTKWGTCKQVQVRLYASEFEPKVSKELFSVWTRFTTRGGKNSRFFRRNCVCAKRKIFEIAHARGKNVYVTRCVFAVSHSKLMTFRKIKISKNLKFIVRWQRTCM